MQQIGTCEVCDSRNVAVKQVSVQYSKGTRTILACTDFGNCVRRWHNQESDNTRIRDVEQALVNAATRSDVYLGKCANCPEMVGWTDTYVSVYHLRERYYMHGHCFSGATGQLVYTIFDGMKPK